MARKIDLTVGVSAHSEGLLLYKTMRAVLNGVSRVHEVGKTVEIILHLDAADEVTREVAEKFRGEKNMRIVENSFKDISKVWNFIAEEAAGEYLAFVDGDDLVSENFFVRAVEMLDKTKEEIVVHTEGVVTFGVGTGDVIFTLQKDSAGKDKDTMLLLGENPWASGLIAKTSTFVETSYRAKRAGYGYEDFVFNIETTNKDIRHVVAPGTVLFYRRDAGRDGVNNNNNNTIPYMELFDFSRVKELLAEPEPAETKPVETVKLSAKERGYKVYKKIRDNDFLNFFITPVAKTVLKAQGRLPKPVKEVSEEIFNEWQKMNEIETQLMPTRDIPHMVSYSAERRIKVGEGYFKIAKSVTKLPDYVFIVPWMIRGGADKVVLNYIEAMHAAHPKWHFAVIATLKADNNWAGKLPEYVDFIDFGKIANGYSDMDRRDLFTRMIVQLKCKKLHIVNSEYGYVWAREHKNLIRAEYTLNVSLFSHDYVPETDLREKFSYDDPYLFEIYDIVNKVYTDNQAVVDYTMKHNGFLTNKFVVQYQPIEVMEHEPKTGLVQEGEMSLLWASRVTPQKIPEMIVEIGKKLPRNVKIYVYGEMAEPKYQGMFDGISQVEYCGRFDGFLSLPIEKMDALLYTSAIDGVPNVLLEAAAVGLPIIAGDEGGVSEVVKNEKTGLLVSDKTDAEEYCEKVGWAYNNMDKMREFAIAAQKLVEKQHSKHEFYEEVKEEF